MSVTLRKTSSKNTQTSINSPTQGVAVAGASIQITAVTNGPTEVHEFYYIHYLDTIGYIEPTLILTLDNVKNMKASNS